MECIIFYSLIKGNLHPFTVTTSMAVCHQYSRFDHFIEVLSHRLYLTLSLSASATAQN